MTTSRASRPRKVDTIMIPTVCDSVVRNCRSQSISLLRLSPESRLQPRPVPQPNARRRLKVCRVPPIHRIVRRPRGAARSASGRGRGVPGPARGPFQAADLAAVSCHLSAAAARLPVPARRTRAPRRLARGLPPQAGAGPDAPPSACRRLTEGPLSDPRSSARARCRAIGSVGRSRARAATVDGRTDRGRNRRLFRRTPRPGEPRRAPRRRRPPRASGHLPTGYRQNRVPTTFVQKYTVRLEPSGAHEAGPRAVKTPQGALSGGPRASSPRTWPRARPLGGALRRSGRARPRRTPSDRPAARVP